MELLVAGAGEMGRWVADAVDADVTFADVDPSLAEAAAAARGANAVTADTTARFDAVCLAVPISVTPEAVADYADNADRAMFDVSGVMAGPIEAMRARCPDRERASFHPLFAPPRAPGTIAAVIDADGPVLRSVRDDFGAGGNEFFETTPAEHDAAMETVQAGAHAAILAWRLAAKEVPEPLHTPVSRRLAAGADTVTEGSPDVYAEIQAAFDGADDVAAAAREIADADPDRFVELYERARCDGERRDGP